ncbi:MAG: FMN-binding protein [Nitrospirota bacterium]|nr:FMN-binding protein [Nitrospirota bacterium]MDH5586848.1 FMN-binding protein [Nitrospirota bacterium]MDH5773471.1 FMN-binding protein [Nitrospirota bacterium]
MFHRILTILLLNTLLSLILIAGVQAQDQQIWDKDLNRYLTPQEMGQEDVYLTQEDAAKLMFPSSDSIRSEIITISEDQKRLIEERIGWHFPETTFDCFIGETKGTVDGWAFVQNTIGKHKPMTYMVGVDPDGEVTNVEILVYRESRGSEVRKKRFNYQFQGKTVSDPIRINRDVINISGATMSVRSMSAGVKRALVLADELYLKSQSKSAPINTASRTDKAFLESLLGF